MTERLAYRFELEREILEQDRIIDEQQQRIRALEAELENHKQFRFTEVTIRQLKGTC